MDIRMLLMFLIIIAGLVIVIVLYKKLYENHANKVLQSGKPKRIVTPLKVLMITLIVIVASVALLWNVLFPDFIVRDIDHEYSVNELFEVYNDILDVYDLRDDQVFFTAGDYLKLRLDEALYLGDSSHNQVSFDIEGVHNRVQFIVYGSDEEVWIPSSTRKMNWTVDELYYPQISYRTMLQVLDMIDVQSGINEIGSLDDEGYYELLVEGEFVTNYDSIEYFVNENPKHYIMNEYGELSLLTEDFFDDNAIYLPIQITRFGKDSETSFSSKDYVVYYYDISGYIID